MTKDNKTASPVRDLSADDLFATFSNEAFGKATEEGNKTLRAKNYKCSIGTTILRVMPPHKLSRTKAAWATRWVHYARTMEKGKVFFTICARHTVGRPCPVCEVHSKLRASDSMRDRSMAAEFEAAKENTCNILVRSEPMGAVAEQEPRRFGMSKTVFERFTDFRARRDFTHPITGKDVLIKRIGSTMLDTKYTADLVDDASPLMPTQAKMKEVADMMEPLDDLLIMPSPEEVSHGFGEWAQKEGLDLRAILRAPAVNLGRIDGGKSNEGVGNDDFSVSSDDEIPF